MRAEFDAHTANFTLDGTFLASPFMRLNHSSYLIETGKGGEAAGIANNDAVQGAIQIRFRGVLDKYNSDILDVNSSSPAWLRTVGFGNNSLNIGDSLNGGPKTRSAMLSALVAPFLAVVISIYII